MKGKWQQKRGWLLSWKLSEIPKPSDLSGEISAWHYTRHVAAPACLTVCAQTDPSLGEPHFDELPSLCLVLGDTLLSYFHFSSNDDTIFFSKVNKTEPLSSKGDGKTLLSPSFWFYKNLILKLEGICWFPPCSFQGLHGVFNLISCHMRKVLGNLYPFETSLKHLM